MSLLDKMAFNRLVAIIANFVLNVIKIFAPKAVEDIEVPEHHLLYQESISSYLLQS